MARLIASIQAFLSHLRAPSGRSRSSRSGRRPPRRRNALTRSRGELLEARTVPSANPIVATAVQVNGFETAPL
ncbi:MAG TPA: hypothetical protein VG125_05360, partial [Pirellulales bacterium]|nr:hypothetical protein [Pirellulales bacterium]